MQFTSPASAHHSNAALVPRVLGAGPHDVGRHQHPHGARQERGLGDAQRERHPPPRNGIRRRGRCPVWREVPAKAEQAHVQIAQSQWDTWHACGSLSDGHVDFSGSGLPHRREATRTGAQPLASVPVQQCSSADSSGVKTCSQSRSTRLEAHHKRICHITKGRSDGGGRVHGARP